MTTKRITEALNILAAAIEADMKDGIGNGLFHSWSIFAHDGKNTTAYFCGGCDSHDHRIAIAEAAFSIAFPEDMPHIKRVYGGGVTQ